MEIFLGILLLIAPIIIIFLAVGYKQKKRIHCKKCKSKFDYDNDVEWEVVSSDVNNNRETVIVEFVCHCNSCGNVQQF